MTFGQRLKLLQGTMLVLILSGIGLVISIAIGIVSPIVTMPHGLDLRALTITRASTEISTIMMPSTATSAV